MGETAGTVSWRWTNWIDTNARQPDASELMPNKFGHRGSLAGKPHGRVRKGSPTEVGRTYPQCMWTLDRNGQAFECGAGHHASRGSTNQAAEKRTSAVLVGGHAISERARARHHQRWVFELRRRCFS